jgi:hypothetical protein
VFAFESLLGSHKRWLSQHKNGVSEGKAIMNQFWAEIVADTLFAINSLNISHRERYLITKGVIRVDDNYYMMKNSRAFLLENVEFDQSLLFLKFCTNDITDREHSIHDSVIDEHWSIVRIFDTYYMYESVHKTFSE